MELFDLEIPIRNTGTSAVLAEWRNMEQTATSSNAKVTASFERASRAVERQLVVFRRGASGIDAIAQRTTVLTQGLQHAGTQAQSLVRLRAAETQLQTAITRGNTSLFERIRLENELVRVRTALTTATQRQAVAQAQGTATQTAGGRIGGVVAGLGTSTRTALTGFLGGVAGGFAVTAATMGIQAVGSAIAGTADAADELDTALRKLKATSRLTGVELGTLETQALEARDAFALGEQQAVDFTAATVRMAQRAGDASKSGALLTAWLDLAAANGQSADEALQGLNTTLIGQDEGLNRLGLQNPQQIYEKWAKAAGTTASRMDDTQKALAIVNEVIQTGARVNGEYAKSLDTAAGAAQKAAQEARALQASIGGLFAGIRRENSELVAEHLREARVAIDFLKEAAVFWGGALKTAIDDAVRAARGMPNFRDATAGGSTTAPGMEPLPDITVDSEALLQTNLAAARLGTANAEILRQLAASARAHAAAARDDSLAQEEQNKHAARAKEINEALAGNTKAATDSVRERTAALIALLELEGPQVERWALLLDRANRLQAAIDKGNLSYAERVRVLTELAAIEAATFPSTLPLDRMKPDRGLDIRRPGAESIPLDLNDPTLRTPITRGGEGSIFGRLAKQIEADGKTALEAADAVEEQLRQAGEGLAVTFEAAVVGAFAAIGSGGSIGEALTGILGTMLGALGEMAIQFGLKSIAIASLMETIMNALASLGPIGAIAAGAALVALGSALKGAASSSFGGGGGGRASVPRNDSFVRINAVGATPQQAVAAASGLSPQQVTVNQTIIGTRDPQAVRAVGEMAAQAVKRGIR